MVSFFFLPSVPENKTAEKRLQRYLDSYQFLRNEYRRVLEQGLLAHGITRFREQFPVRARYSDCKIIDTLIWKYVSFLRSGVSETERLRLPNPALQETRRKLCG